MKTQCERLLEALQQGCMTAREISEQLGIDRAAARVHELRQEGHSIVAENVMVKNRYGQTCRVACYRLVQRSAAAA